MRILLVEDNDEAAIALMAALRLPRAGGEFNVVHVDRLEHAMNELRRGGLDAAVVDLGLPDSVGLDAPEALRAAAPELPIVVWTGHDCDGDALKLISHGIQDYVVKGEVTVQRVRQAITFAIERKRAERRERERAERRPREGADKVARRDIQ
jgi:DNA-binding response OmpR family regulator